MDNQKVVQLANGDLLLDNNCSYRNITGMQ